MRLVPNWNRFFLYSSLEVIFGLFPRAARNLISVPKSCLLYLFHPLLPTADKLKSSVLQENTVLGFWIYHKGILESIQQFTALANPRHQD